MSDIAKMIAIAKKFGGGSSTPAPVVILPETELASAGEGQFTLTTPLHEIPSPGDVVRIVYNGATYECTCEMKYGGDDAIVFGNLAPLDIGITGNNGAPFAFLIPVTALDADEDGNPDVYAVLVPLDGATDATVEVVKVYSYKSKGETFRVDVAVNIADREIVNHNKTYGEIKQAFDRGMLPYCIGRYHGGSAQNMFVLSLIDENSVTFNYRYGGIDDSIYICKDGTVEYTRA